MSKSQPPTVVVDPTALADAPFETLITAQGTGGVPTFTGGGQLISKDALEGVPFFVTKVINREDKDTFREYVSVEATTAEYGQVVFNDGGTGARQQLQHYLAADGPLPLYVPSGLRASRYNTERIENGKPVTVKATTYYLA